MKAKFTLAFALAMTLLCQPIFATVRTWYVREGATGGDGSEASPFGVIQDAVTAAAGGDTIVVGEGTYSTGGGDESGILSRVSIVNKPGLKLKGAELCKDFDQETKV